MLHNPAEQLHIIGPLPQGALGGFANGGECFFKQAVDRCLTICDHRFETRGTGAKLCVGQRFQPGFEVIDRLHLWREFLEFAIIGRAKYAPGKGAHAHHMEKTPDLRAVTSSCKAWPYRLGDWSET